MVRAVLFDLFGTVIAYDQVEEGTYQAWAGVHRVAQRLGLQMDYEPFAAEWQRQFESRLAPEDDRDASVFVGKIMRLFRSLGLPEDREAADEAATACLAAWGAHVSVPADAVPTLEALHHRCRLALVTNFDHPPFVYEIMAQRGLAGRFDAVVVSGELRIDKPDPRIFWHALEAVQVAPEDALMVGDSVSADIEGAHAAGCQAVLIDRLGWHPEYAGPRIHCLSDLLALT